MEREGETIHGSVVAAGGRGLLILGPSGSGKSALALELMAYGARLVADDRVRLVARGGALWASAPARLAGLIEARGLGILSARSLARARLVLVADLGAPAPARLPEMGQMRFGDMALPLVSGPLRPHLGPALLQYLRGGRAM